MFVLTHSESFSETFALSAPPSFSLSPSSLFSLLSLFSSLFPLLFSLYSSLSSPLSTHVCLLSLVSHFISPSIAVLFLLLPFSFLFHVLPHNFILALKVLFKSEIMKEGLENKFSGKWRSRHTYSKCGIYGTQSWPFPNLASLLLPWPLSWFGTYQFQVSTHVQIRSQPPVLLLRWFTSPILKSLSFVLSTWETETSTSLNLRPTWWIPGQSGLHSETLP